MLNAVARWAGEMTGKVRRHKGPERRGYRGCSPFFLAVALCAERERPWV